MNISEGTLFWHQYSEWGVGQEKVFVWYSGWDQHCFAWTNEYWCVYLVNVVVQFHAHKLYINLNGHFDAWKCSSLPTFLSAASFQTYFFFFKKNEGHNWQVKIARASFSLRWIDLKLFTNLQQNQDCNRRFFIHFSFSLPLKTEAVAPFGSSYNVMARPRLYVDCF